MKSTNNGRNTAGFRGRHEISSKAVPVINASVSKEKVNKSEQSDIGINPIVNVEISLKKKLGIPRGSKSKEKKMVTI